MLGTSASHDVDVRDIDGDGVSLMIGVTVDPATVGPLTNSASVTSSLTDGNILNNSNSCVTLAIPKSCPAAAIAGGPISYSITVPAPRPRSGLRASGLRGL